MTADQNETNTNGVKTITRLISERIGRPITEKETRTVCFLVNKDSVPLDTMHKLVDEIYMENLEIELEAGQKRREFLESMRAKLKGQ